MVTLAKTTSLLEKISTLGVASGRLFRMRVKGLTADIVTSGATINLGSNAFDGRHPACLEYSSFLCGETPKLIGPRRLGPTFSFRRCVGQSAHNAQSFGFKDRLVFSFHGTAAGKKKFAPALVLGSRVHLLWHNHPPKKKKVF